LTTEDERKVKKGISEIVGAIYDPIIVWPGGWGDTLPDWIKGAITLERLIENMKAFRDGEEITGTDAEACAYLYTVCLAQPVSHDWTQIYLYVATKTIEKQRVPKTTMPEDIRVDLITDYQMGKLNHLKSWIYRRRAERRQERDRAERRQEKEKAVAEKEALQPSMFDLE
jgi:hypothetical protein